MTPNEALTLLWFFAGLTTAWAFRPAPPEGGGTRKAPLRFPLVLAIGTMGAFHEVSVRPLVNVAPESRDGADGAGTAQRRVLSATWGVAGALVLGGLALERSGGTAWQRARRVAIVVGAIGGATVASSPRLRNQLLMWAGAMSPDEALGMSAPRYFSYGWWWAVLPGAYLTMTVMFMEDVGGLFTEGIARRERARRRPRGRAPSERKRRLIWATVALAYLLPGWAIDRARPVSLTLPGPLGNNGPWLALLGAGAFLAARPRSRVARTVAIGVWAFAWGTVLVLQFRGLGRSFLNAYWTGIAEGGAAVRSLAEEAIRWFPLSLTWALPLFVLACVLVRDVVVAFARLRTVMRPSTIGP